mmetsp:Transcript_22217/g.54752  ORF Transcript_22217/g.54752 Transcript_22217/m.54752 type:complete len:205 (-) Transcript_22217:3-617(-)
MPPPLLDNLLAPPGGERGKLVSVLLLADLRRAPCVGTRCGPLLHFAELEKRDRAVVVTVPVVLVVKHIAHKVVKVVTVRHPLVPAVGTVHVTRLMPPVGLLLLHRHTAPRVAVRDGEDMAHDLVPLLRINHAVQVPVHKEAVVVPVLDGRVPALLPVVMSVCIQGLHLASAAALGLQRRLDLGAVAWAENGHGLAHLSSPRRLG